MTARRGFRGPRPHRMAPVDPISPWLLILLGVSVPAVSTAVGVSAANFWVPIHLIVLGMPPAASFWLAVATMVFGYGSASIGFLARGAVDGGQVRRYCAVSIPAALIGVAAYPFVPVRLLLGTFAGFVAIYAGIHVRRLLAAPSEPPSHDRIRWRAAALGGLTTGLVSVGLGALVREACVTYGHPPSPERGTGSVAVIVFATSLAAAAARLFWDPALGEALASHGDRIRTVMVWIAPSVMVGGQLGPVLVRRLPPRFPRTMFAGVLWLVAASMAVRAWNG